MNNSILITAVISLVAYTLLAFFIGFKFRSLRNGSQTSLVNAIGAFFIIVGCHGCCELAAIFSGQKWMLMFGQLLVTCALICLMKFFLKKP